MFLYKSILFLLFFFSFIPFCFAKDLPTDRPAAVAGMFYPAAPDELRQMLAGLFAKAVKRQDQGAIVALIVPHAGYVYSGEVAASGFNQIDPDQEYDNVFILGPSHRVGFEGASVFAGGHFITPLGAVEVNKDLAERLCATDPVFTIRPDAQALEHSIEVEIPFLQHHLKKPFRLVPIVLGANQPETCQKIAKALLPYLNKNNLFVISTDLSHYPGYDDAVRVDQAIVNAIVTNIPDNLIKTMAMFKDAGLANLGTTLCGASGVLTLLYMTSSGTDTTYHPIQYKNSGDTPIGDKGRVVGYQAITVTQKPRRDMTSFELNNKDKSTLLTLARSTVEQCVGAHSASKPVLKGLSETLKTPCGAFVTLKKHGQLRGCIGRFDAAEPLYKVVQEMAKAAATQDYRFRPVEEAEVRDLSIEISVLTPMRKINSIDEVELGRHGIYIRKGSRSGTFLPQVATETGWTKEEFLGHCARDKAGIGWDGWKDAEVFVYEALVFGET